MSDDQPCVFSMTLPGDWWYLAAAARQIARIPTRENPDPSIETREAGHYTIIVHDAAAVRELGSLLFEPGEHSTTLRLQSATPDDMRYWMVFGERIRALAYDAQRLKRTFEPDADEVIEHYYRSRAQGSRITLRQLAEETGFSYSYLRTVKTAYDRAGKWGSKSKKMQGRAGTKTIE